MLTLSEPVVRWPKGPTKMVSRRRVNLNQPEGEKLSEPVVRWLKGQLAENYLNFKNLTFI